ncbi:MAG: heme transporter HemC, partial [Caedimonadaceae bacterium]
MKLTLAKPRYFLKITNFLLPIGFVLGALCFAAGLYSALITSPPDYQQGDAMRIMYIHVPASWMALFCYSVLAAFSLFVLVWRHPFSEILAISVAPIGALFTGLSLVTGSLWGKPMWGTYWVWDARLTSVLVLLFLYAGYWALYKAYA